MTVSSKKLLLVAFLLFATLLAYFSYSYFKTLPPVTEATPVTQAVTTPVLVTFTDTNQNISFTYPKTLPTTYIHPVDWPPKITITPNTPKLSCAEGGKDIATGGETHQILIGRKDYCLTTEVEGAAGSIYTTYTYKTWYNGILTTLTFILRSVQCANYDDPNKTECENERTAFNINAIVGLIMSSVIFTK